MHFLGKFFLQFATFSTQSLTSLTERSTLVEQRLLYLTMVVESGVAITGLVGSVLVVTSLVGVSKCVVLKPTTHQWLPPKGSWELGRATHAVAV